MNVDTLTTADLRHEQFLRQIEAREVVERPAAERMAAAVLAVLRLRLSAGQADELEAELPEGLLRLLHRVEDRAWRHGGKHEEAVVLTLGEFLDGVSGRLRVPADRAQEICRSVFEAVRLLLAPNLIGRIAKELPPELRQLFMGHPTLMRWAAGVREPGPGSTGAFRAMLSRFGVLQGIPLEDAAKTVLALLLRRLSPGEGAKAFDALPSELREWVGEALQPSVGRLQRFDRDGLIDATARALGTTRPHADGIVRGVLAAARPLVAKDEAARIGAQLPDDIRELWDRPVSPPEEDLDARLDELVADVKRALACDDAFAFAALAEVLTMFEETLGGGVARHLVDQLPWRLAVVLDQARPLRASPPHPLSHRAALRRIGERFDADSERAEQLIRAVFDAVRRQLTDEQSRAISSELPADLKNLWWNRPVPRKRQKAAKRPEEAVSRAEPEAEPATEGEAMSLPRAVFYAAIGPFVRAGFRALERARASSALSEFRSP